MNTKPDLSKVVDWDDYMLSQKHLYEIKSMYSEAKDFLEFYDWCSEVQNAYVGILYPGIVGVFLFRIIPAREDVDEWIWVVVGDLPSAYLTAEDCPNPAAALDGYIGAMMEWVQAAQNGEPVADLIPVNVPATRENGDILKARLTFLDQRILTECQYDLS